jgi:hypothetical protein
VDGHIDRLLTAHRHCKRSDKLLKRDYVNRRDVWDWFRAVEHRRQPPHLAVLVVVELAGRALGMMWLEVAVDQFRVMTGVRRLVDVLWRQHRERKHTQHGNAGDTFPRRGALHHG